MNPEKLRRFLRRKDLKDFIRWRMDLFPFEFTRLKRARHAVAWIGSH